MKQLAFPPDSLSVGRADFYLLRAGKQPIPTGLGLASRIGAHQGNHRGRARSSGAPSIGGGAQSPFPGGEHAVAHSEFTGRPATQSGAFSADADPVVATGVGAGPGSQPTNARIRGTNFRAGRVQPRSQLSTVHGLQPIRCPTSFRVSPRSSRRFRSCSPRVTGSLGYCRSMGFGPRRVNWQKGNAGVSMRLAGASEARLHVCTRRCGALSCARVRAGDGSH